jgi:phospholipid/cholesterol/gamma-HCH transport system substrate-binding protein
MENRAHAIAAGLFTLLLGAALVAAVIWLRGESVATDAYVLHTKGSVGGLNVQAPVRFRGVDVGKVESIQFDARDPRVILVKIAVRRGTPLTRGAFGQLAAQGVTGLSYVQLNDDGSNNQLRDPTNAAQARIELRPSFLERMSESGEQLVARVAAVAEQLEQWLSADSRRKVMQTLAAFETAAQRVSALTESAQPGAKAIPALVLQARETLQHADATLSDLRTLVATFGKRAEAIDRVAASAERIGAAVQDASAAGISLAASASRETIPRVNLLLDEVARSTRSLDRLLEELNANPSSIVFGRIPQPPGPGEPGFAHGAER